MKTIVMTGAAGNLGQNLLRRLAASTQPYKLRALDVAASPNLPDGVEYHRVDVRDPDIGKYFEGCDAVLHLAFVVERGSRDPAMVDAINIGGTQNVFEAAARAGVGHVLYASSIAAYGVHPENVGVELKEDAPIRGNEDFYYSRTKAEVERWLDQFAARHPGMKITRFRPCIFLEPGAARSAIFSRLPFMPYFSGANCPVQVMHQDDVAQAFELALQKGVAGTFNLATREPLPISGWATALGKRGVPIPQGALRLAEAAYKAGRTQVDPVWYRFGLEYPIVVDASRARDELGWKPAYPTTAAVLEALAAREQSGSGSRPVRVLMGFLASTTRVFGAITKHSIGLAGINGTLNLNLTGPQPSVWHFWIKEGNAGFGKGRGRHARATVTMAEEDFLRLINGELQWTTACMIGKARLEGDGGFMMVAGGVMQKLREIVDASSAKKAPARLAKQALRRAMGLEIGRSA